MSNGVGVGVACFIWKDGKFLLAQRQGAHGAGTWTVPGGHVEFGESWEEAAVREVMEETGLTITKPQLVAVTNDIMADEHKHYVTIWLEADWQLGEASILEPEKCMRQGWYDFSTLPAPLFEPYWQNLRRARPDLFA